MEQVATNAGEFDALQMLNMAHLSAPHAQEHVAPPVSFGGAGPAAGTTTVTVRKGERGGFGFSCNDQCVVLAAAQHSNVPQGARILTINSVPVRTRRDIGAQLRASGVEASLEVELPAPPPENDAPSVERVLPAVASAMPARGRVAEVPAAASAAPGLPADAHTIEDVIATLREAATKDKALRSGEGGVTRADVVRVYDRALLVTQDVLSRPHIREQVRDALSTKMKVRRSPVPRLCNACAACGAAAAATGGHCHASVSS